MAVLHKTKSLPLWYDITQFTVSGSTPKVRLYCCHAPVDALFRDELEQHLATLRKLGYLESWHAGLLPPGESVEDIKSRKIDEADLIVVLVSVDLVSSDALGPELARVMDRQERGDVTVIPILIRPVEYQGLSLSRLRPLPTDGRPVVSWQDRDQAWSDVVRGIGEAVRQINKTGPVSVNTSVPAGRPIVGGAVDADVQLRRRFVADALASVPDNPRALEDHSEGSHQTSSDWAVEREPRATRGAARIVFLPLLAGTWVMLLFIVELRNHAVHGLCPSTMVELKPSRFSVGGEGPDPSHQVRITRAYCIDATEVTNAAYQECVDSHRCAPRGEDFEKLPGADFTSPQQPVVLVSWTDADTYCRWRGKRLPTEAEWEHAARGDQNQRYPWGDDEPECETAVISAAQIDCSGDDTDCQEAKRCRGRNPTHPIEVATRLTDCSPFKVFDLGGNVSEWVADWYGEYQKSSPHNPERDPPGRLKGTKRVFKGGSWGQGESYSRAAMRHGLTPDATAPDLGFRCAKDRDI